MATVWKTELHMWTQGVLVPEGARFLDVGWQPPDSLVAWFLCDPSKSVESRLITVVYTGAPAPDDGHYVGTIQHPSGLVYHVFEGPRSCS